MNLPGKKKNAAPPVPAPLSRLENRRDELRTKFSELQWDLGGAAYEMAARDYFRLDVLASMAARLQVVDAELAEIERMARLERAGAAGSCAGCGSLYARGAVYCWRCGRSLTEGRGTIVGPAVTAPTVPPGSKAPPEPFVDPVVRREPDPVVRHEPEPTVRREPETTVRREPETVIEHEPARVPEAASEPEPVVGDPRPVVGYRPGAN